MRSEEEIKALLNTLKYFRNRYREWDIRFCVDCMNLAKEECEGRHTTIIENPCYEGIREWIRCLSWVLGEEAPK